MESCLSKESSSIHSQQWTNQSNCLHFTSTPYNNHHHNDYVSGYIGSMNLFSSPILPLPMDTPTVAYKPTDSFTTTEHAGCVKGLTELLVDGISWHTNWTLGFDSVLMIARKFSVTTGSLLHIWVHVSIILNLQKRCTSLWFWWASF